MAAPSPSPTSPTPNRGALDKGIIIYTLIARGEVVLTEWSSPERKGNFAQITRDILKRIDPYTTRKMSYSYDDHTHYHIWVDAGLIYLVMAEAQFGKRRSYAFLADIRTLFLSKFGDSWQNAIGFGLNAQFCRTLEQRANFFSYDPNSDKMTALETEIQAAKNVLVENIEKLIERGEKIDLLVEKTETLQEETFQMKGKSKKLRLKLWWRNMKIWLCICCVICVILFIIIWVACGFPNFKDCGGGGSTTEKEVIHEVDYKPAPEDASQPVDATVISFFKLLGLSK